jgi:hypothetical protein
MHQCHPYILDNSVDRVHINRQICHIPNNYGLIIDRQHVNQIGILDDCDMHLLLAIVLLSLLSIDVKIYLFTSSVP